MKSLTIIVLVGCTITIGQAFVVPHSEATLNKVFEYVGPLPLKEEKVNENNKTDSSIVTVDTTSQDLSEAEVACWGLIVERSTVTFAMQSKVLDELDTQWKQVNVDEQLYEAVNKITVRMRNSMNQALDALKKEVAEEFFDALFESSEDIVRMSYLMRDPKLDENVFLILVKAVSRLGRNNSALIQDFTDKCSFVVRSPRPRGLINE